EWRQDSPLTHVVLDASRGVGIEKMERLIYRLSYGGKSVIFALNDLSQVKPPASALAHGEKFIGPIFDESAIRFFLVYNSKLPDNFNERKTLKQPMLEISPGLKGKIDRFGSSQNSEVRFLIKPYASYQTESDLYGVDKCARTRVRAASYYACFVAEPADSDFG